MVFMSRQRCETAVVPEGLLARLPLRFEPNRGQADPEVRFLSRVNGARVLPRRDEAVIDSLRIRPVGGNADPLFEGIDRLPGATHYFIGDNPQRWRTDIPAFARVRYRAVYPGVDLVFYGEGRQLEYDFVVAPGGDPSVIRLEYQGVEGMVLEGGDLVLRTVEGEIRQHAPVVYQDAHGARRRIDGQYVRPLLSGYRSVTGEQLE
jgi:hypothetical protein